MGGDPTVGVTGLASAWSPERPRAQAQALLPPPPPPPPPPEVRGRQREAAAAPPARRGAPERRGLCPAGSPRGRKRKCSPCAMAAEVLTLGGLAAPDPDGGVRRRRGRSGGDGEREGCPDTVPVAECGLFQGSGSEDEARPSTAAAAAQKREERLRKFRELHMKRVRGGRGRSGTGAAPDARGSAAEGTAGVVRHRPAAPRCSRAGCAAGSPLPSQMRRFNVAGPVTSGLAPSRDGRPWSSRALLFLFVRSGVAPCLWSSVTNGFVLRTRPAS